MSTGPEISKEQLRYASLLNWLIHIGLGLLLCGFLIYALGLRPHLVPIEDLASLWGVRATDYVEAAGVPIRWDWIHFLGYGDMLCIPGIIWLASTSILCCGAILPIFASRKDRAYLVIAILQIMVLLAAASGLLAVTH